MSIIMSFKMAFSSVLASKVRSFLTMLGIIIGVSAVIILVSMVTAATKDMRTQLEGMGTNLVSVNIWRGGWGNTRSITVADVNQFCEENAEIIAYHSPAIESGVNVKYGSTTLSAELYGVSEDYAAIRNREAVEGRFITASDVENRSAVCVVGQYIVNELFKGQDPIGQEIKLSCMVEQFSAGGREMQLNSAMFTIVGVLDQKSSNMSAYGDDGMIIIPYTKAQRFISNNNVNSFVISAVSGDKTSEVTEKVENFLYNKFKSNGSYYVMDQAEMLGSIDEALSVMAILAGGIAGISLLVAGIGIMNIMLVTVTERTREIGIRKSIGARTGTILVQFLIESAVLSCMGGVIGIVLGVAGSAGICRAMGMPVLSIFDQMGIILIAFLFSAAMGILFGLYPARRAAKLNPVDALRFE